MKRRNLIYKIAVFILSFSLILIPVTSSTSFAQPESAAAGGKAAGGTAGLSKAAIVGIAAAAVAVGWVVVEALDDDDPVPTHRHPATPVH